MRAMPPSWMLAALVALLAGAVSSLVTLAFARPAERGPDEVRQAVDRSTVDRSTVDRSTVDPSTVEQRLHELGLRIDSALAELRTAGGANPTVRELVAASAAEVPELQALVERFDRLERMLRAGVVGAPSLSRSMPVQQRALQDLDALQRQDPDAAKRSTMLLTPAEIVQRFGFPDDVGGANGNGVYWNYHHLGLHGQRDGGILFVFIDGRVAWHEISIPDR